MSVKNSGVFRAQILRNFALDFLKLLARAHERLLQAIEFSWNFVFGNVASLNALARLVENENFSPAYASRNRNPPENAFTFVYPFGHNAQIAVAGGFEKQFLA